MAHTNRKLAPEVDHGLLHDRLEHSYLSSSLVKEIVGFLAATWTQMVPAGVVRRLVCSRTRSYNPSNRQPLPPARGRARR